MTAEDAGGAGPAGPRGLARLRAVQALYQIEIGAAGRGPVIDEFIGFRINGEGEEGGEGREDGEDPGARADPDFFRDVVSGVDLRGAEIASAVGDALLEGWSYGRLDTTLRQILRAGAYELMARVDVPARAVINEYVELANAFFDGSEPGFVNAVLDRLGRRYRSGEMAAARDAPAASGRT